MRNILQFVANCYKLQDIYNHGKNFENFEVISTSLLYHFILL